MSSSTEDPDARAAPADVSEPEEAQAGSHASGEQLAARQSTALVEGVFRTVPVGLAFWDTDLRYVRVNKALEQMFGVPAGELLGRTLFELRPEHGAGLTPVIEQVLATGKPVLDLELNGERSDEPGVGRVWVTSFFPVRDPAGELLGVGCSASDVTAERNARAEQARAEARVRFLARASEPAERDARLRADAVGSRGDGGAHARRPGRHRPHRGGRIAALRRRGSLRPGA